MHKARHARDFIPRIEIKDTLTSFELINRTIYVYFIIFQ